ncbi:MAG: hypothetical protein ACLQVM_02205 [Terriglobia bacterium]
MRSFAPEGRRAKQQHVCATHVDGYWYQDNAGSYSHTASYNFDNVNRRLAQGETLDSAGINRLGVANERVVQGRHSEPPWPPAMRGRS